MDVNTESNTIGEPKIEGKHGIFEETTLFQISQSNPESLSPNNLRLAKFLQRTAERLTDEPHDFNHLIPNEVLQRKPHYKDFGLAFAKSLKGVCQSDITRAEMDRLSIAGNSFPQIAGRGANFSEFEIWFTRNAVARSDDDDMIKPLVLNLWLPLSSSRRDSMGVSCNGILYSYDCDDNTLSATQSNKIGEDREKKGLERQMAVDYLKEFANGIPIGYPEMGWGTDL